MIFEQKYNIINANKLKQRKIHPNGIVFIILNLLNIAITKNATINLLVLLNADAIPIFSSIEENVNAFTLANTNADPINIGIIAIKNETIVNLNIDIPSNNIAEIKINPKPSAVAFLIDT